MPAWVETDLQSPSCTFPLDGPRLPVLSPLLTYRGREGGEKKKGNGGNLERVIRVCHVGSKPLRTKLERVIRPVFKVWGVRLSGIVVYGVKLYYTIVQGVIRTFSHECSRVVGTILFTCAHVVTFFLPHLHKS